MFVLNLIMFQLYLTLALVVCSVLGENASKALKLPSWITENPAFKHPTIKDSIKTGNGSISEKVKGDCSWLIHLNEKAGHGIELKLESLSLNPDLNEYLLVSAWPMTAGFIQIKLFTGKFNESLRTLHIPNTKTFFVLYSTSTTTSSYDFSLKYRRYGTSFEVAQPPTDSPIKKKETVFEVQLKGKSPSEFLIENFSKKLKEGLREAARRYCIANKIPFNQRIPTEEMVLIHRVSYCPFEWPDRNICASVQHSIFVSGERVEDVIMDYQLTTDHLRIMWSENNFQELERLGVTVFQLPQTYIITFYWMVIIGIMIISSLFATCVFWKTYGIGKISIRKNSTASEAKKKTKKPKLRLTKHQRVPSFMCTSPTETQKEKFKEIVMQSVNVENMLKQNFEDVIKPGDSSQLPIRNYFGSILFSSNKAFEDDEDNSIELRPK